ncbi:WhiB family transcriptional regulator, partial [Streptomyces sp. t39]|uniref:WhiB family transcriptional regulator n=1 Tax=Streptomyces sp. t39 TaxID=1828156 RepID=UPI0021C58BCB
MPTPLSAREARHMLTDHRHYRYRGCAPDPDQPTQAAGNPGLSIDAWSDPTDDGGEHQTARRARQKAAIDVCLGCPVMVQCLTAATAVMPDGTLAEPYGVAGGMTALERHRKHIKNKHTVPQPLPAGDARLRTPQRLAVLRALAVHTDPVRVAATAGVDVRTANWQRARLVTMLGLDRESASRAELLAAAAKAGLLDGITVVDQAAMVPAVPAPGTSPVEQTVVAAPAGRNVATVVTSTPPEARDADSRSRPSIVTSRARCQFAVRTSTPAVAATRTGS